MRYWLGPAELDTARNWLSLENCNRTTPRLRMGWKIVLTCWPFVALRMRTQRSLSPVATRAPLGAQATAPTLAARPPGLACDQMTGGGPASAKPAMSRTPAAAPRTARKRVRERIGHLARSIESDRRDSAAALIRQHVAV